jgi:DNA-binding MarR family transcriptional regulator
MSTQVSTSAPQETLALTAWVRLLRAHAAIARTFNAQLQAEHGMTINDFEALLLLSHAPDTRLKRIELADRLQLTPSGVTRMLDGLQAAGWVAKGECASDARVSYAVLTDAGREKLACAAHAHTAAVTSLFAERFDDTELEALGLLLLRLPGAADADPEACTVGEPT